MSALVAPPPADALLGSGGFLSKFAALAGFPDATNIEAELANSLPLRIGIALLDNLLQEGLTGKELALILP